VSPTLLRHSSDTPPTLLRHSSDTPPTLLRHSSDTGVSKEIAIADVVRGVLADAMKAFYAVLAQYTLEDVVGNRRELAPILFPVKNEPTTT